MVMLWVFLSFSVRKKKIKTKEGIILTTCFKEEWMRTKEGIGLIRCFIERKYIKKRKASF